PARPYRRRLLRQQHLGLADRPVRGRDEQAQQVGEPVGEGTLGGLVEQVAAVLQCRVYPVGRTVRRTPLEQLEGQVGLGGPGAEEQRLRLHARQPHRRVRRVVQGEHRLEQRVPGQGTGRRERVDQRLERQVLVRVGGQVRGADAVEQFLE